MKKIPLTQGKYALVDDCDYEYLCQWKWNYNYRGYAVRAIHKGYVKGKRKRETILMHRIINKTPDGIKTDHIDGDRLNNRRRNLRNATRSQNMMNRKSAIDSSSKYKGVYRHRKNKVWVAQIRWNKNSKYLGSFKSEISAAKSYDIAAKKYHGKFALTNF